MSKLLRDVNSILRDPNGRTIGWQQSTHEGYDVALHEGDAGSNLEIKAPDGRICVTIHLHLEGLRVELFGAQLHAHAREKMCLSAPHVEIAATESLTLSSGGSIHQRAAGELRSEAFEHHFESTHGDITLVANDDVALDGERIRLNSPAKWLPPHLRKPGHGQGVDER